MPLRRSAVFGTLLGPVEGVLQSAWALSDPSDAI